MSYKVIAECFLEGKTRKAGDIIPASEIETDPFFNFYIYNGSLEPVKETKENKKSKK